MKNAAEKAAGLLKVLANPKRLMIVCRLVEGEASVTELAEFLGMRSSTVSQHLQVLRLSNLVHTRRQAQTIYYSLAHTASENLIHALHKTYCIMPERKKTTKAASQSKTGKK